MTREGRRRDHMMLHLPLATLAAATAAAATAASTPQWSVSLSATGHVNLDYNHSQFTLTGVCPRLALQPAAPPVSLCGSLLWEKATLGKPSPGTDPRYGSYTRHVVSFKPRALSTAPAADLELRAFHPVGSAPVGGNKIMHVRLRLAEPVHTNRIEPLALASFAFGRGGARRVLDIPFDNDIQSV